MQETQIPPLNQEDPCVSAAGGANGQRQRLTGAGARQPESRTLRAPPPPNLNQVLATAPPPPRPREALRASNLIPQDAWEEVRGEGGSCVLRMCLPQLLGVRLKAGVAGTCLPLSATLQTENPGPVSSLIRAYQPPVSHFICTCQPLYQ